jgi:hypothetical protein
LHFVEAEAAAAPIADALPPVPDGSGKDGVVYSLPLVVSLAAIRLAVSFGSSAAMYTALRAPGLLTVLSADTLGVDETLYKVPFTLTECAFATRKLKVLKNNPDFCFCRLVCEPTL